MFQKESVTLQRLLPFSSTATAQQRAAAFCSLHASCIEFHSQTHLFTVEVMSWVAANEKSKLMYHGEQILLTLWSLRWVNDVGYTSLLIAIIVSRILYTLHFLGARCRTWMPSDIFDKLSRINLPRKCCAQLNYGKAASVLKAVERDGRK